MLPDTAWPPTSMIERSSLSGSSRPRTQATSSARRGGLAVICAYPSEREAARSTRAERTKGANSSFSRRTCSADLQPKRRSRSECRDAPLCLHSAHPIDAYNDAYLTPEYGKARDGCGDRPEALSDGRANLVSLKTSHHPKTTRGRPTRALTPTRSPRHPSSPG